MDGIVKIYVVGRPVRGVRAEKQVVRREGMRCVTIVQHVPIRRDMNICSGGRRREETQKQPVPACQGRYTLNCRR